MNVVSAVAYGNWKRSALATLRMCWYLCSTIEFCLGISMQEWKLWTPFDLTKYESSILVHCLTILLLFWFDIELEWAIEAGENGNNSILYTHQVSPCCLRTVIKYCEEKSTSFNSWYLERTQESIWTKSKGLGETMKRTSPTMWWKPILRMIWISQLVTKPHAYKVSKSVSLPSSNSVTATHHLYRGKNLGIVKLLQSTM